MHCRVNGQQVEPKQLARRAMNFNQPFPSAEPPLRYDIAVPIAEFVASLRDAYQQAVEEEIDDAPYHQDGDWPVLDRLRNVGYPPLEQIIDTQPELFVDLVREWLDMETLDHLIPGSATELPEYLVNSIDCVAVDHNGVHIQGQAFHHPALMRKR